uniref:Uncharacterized protein n=1 Tax=Arundo donax TaxID=35708 RepID=A0A0A8ZRW9_ARUDO
MPTGKGLFA